ncbi:nuclear transport factor 2 family protein [Rhodococcus triatomae]
MSKDIARDMMQCWENGDFDRARSLVADGATAWLAHADGATGAQPNGGTSMSLIRWLELLDGVVREMPRGLAVTTHRMIAEGDWVAADVESVGETDDGRVYNMRYTFWFEVRSDRIHRLKQFFDTKYGEQFFLDRNKEIPA